MFLHGHVQDLYHYHGPVSDHVISLSNTKNSKDLSWNIGTIMVNSWKQLTFFISNQDSAPWIIVFIELNRNMGMLTEKWVLVCWSIIVWIFHWNNFAINKLEIRCLRLYRIKSLKNRFPWGSSLKYGLILSDFHSKHFLLT